MVELGFCVFERLRYWCDIGNTPVCVFARAAVLPFEPVAGRQFLNTIYQGPRTWNVIHGEITIQSLETETAFDFRMDENPLQFRSKEDILASFGDIKGLNAYAIARQNQTLLGIAPNGNRKHASEPLETVGIPLKKRLKNCFRIAV